MSTSCGGIFDVAGKEAAGELEAEMGAPTFWEDNRRAQELIRERSELWRGPRLELSPAPRS